MRTPRRILRWVRRTCRCLRDGDKLTPEQLAAKGANDSLIHVDWMIGSDKLDIDGITAADVAEPLMRQGEWV